MEYQKSVIELIKQRSSCRSYNGEKIEENKITRLTKFIDEINSTMDIKARFLYVDCGRVTDGEAQKHGTYGMISGECSYIMSVLDINETQIEKFGYQFEKIILLATDMGLGTCWLGGTFKYADFEKKTYLKKNEYIPIVSPVGYASDKQSFKDTLVRRLAGSDNRKQWSEIFFDTTPDKPLTEAEAGEYKVPLDMVRLAPSATNRQPWRIIRDKDGFNFYLSRTPNYSLLRFDFQKNDVGIAMCHFELTAKELGLTGKWEIIGKDSIKDMEYIATWRF